MDIYHCLLFQRLNAARDLSKEIGVDGAHPVFPQLQLINIHSPASTQQHQNHRIPSQKPIPPTTVSNQSISPKHPLQHGSRNSFRSTPPHTRAQNTYILLTNRSLLTGLPFFPPAALGVSVHISLTFSSTILQWRSKALTRASSLRLLRHEMSTWVWERTAVCRIDSGPEVNSYSSSWAISYSLGGLVGGGWGDRGWRDGLGGGEWART